MSHYGELSLTGTLVLQELEAQGIELELWPDTDSKILYATRARIVLQEFFTTYPASLRAYAGQMLLEHLPSGE